MNHLFTCKNCGSHDLIVEHHFTIASGALLTNWREWGPLDDDHHWEYDDSEEVERLIDDEYEGEDEATPETLEDSHEFYVFCGDCDREIEFGWSGHGEVRAGRIWPVECTDFNPWKSNPEPRYRAAWKERRWLRPGA